MFLDFFAVTQYDAVLIQCMIITMGVPNNSVKNDLSQNKSCLGKITKMYSKLYSVDPYAMKKYRIGQIYYRNIPMDSLQVQLKYAFAVVSFR